MSDILEKMNPDKRKALINAGMNEFAANSFKKASTNSIVKAAGISKGLLYHYFHSKEELFDYLVDYAMNSVATPIAEQVGLDNTDIIDRIWQITELKMKIMEEIPALVPFSKVMYAGKDLDEIMVMIEKYHPVPVEMYYRSNIDDKLFKDGINIEIAVNTIKFTLEKFSEDILKKRNMGVEWDAKQTTNEVKGYLEHFRQVYYK